MKCDRAKLWSYFFVCLCLWSKQLNKKRTFVYSFILIDSLTFAVWFMLFTKQKINKIVFFKLNWGRLRSAAAIMSTSPGKHKSSHHHHHHHHREHHHSSSSGGTSGYSSTSIQKSTPNLASLIKIQDNSKLLPHYSVGKFLVRTPDWSFN